MKILGIVASARYLGNTEILVKEALMAAEEQGAEVNIMRWTDYRILPCEGDATCIFGKRECKLKEKDDHDFLLEKIYQSDGVVFGTPCYFLEATAIVKQFIDRLFILFSQPSRAAGKPAAIIVPYGARGWTSYAFLQPTILLHQLDMNIISRVQIHVQAVGEVVGNQAALDKARRVGIGVAQAVKSGDHSYRGERGICPVCHERNIRILNDNVTVECGICGIRGTIRLEDGLIRVDFPAEQLKWHRFSAESIYRHFTYEIKPSKDYFAKIWPVFKEKRAKYAHYLDIRPHRDSRKSNEVD